MSPKKLVITVSIVVLLLIGGGVAYVLTSGMLSPPAEETEEQQAPAPDLTTGDAYKVQLEEKRVEVEGLVAAGDEESIKQAETIVKAEVKAAEESGNIAYHVDAQLAHAALLIDTGRAQEALDSILLPLEREYEGNQTYINDIYGYISLAYKWIENLPKSEEYLNKIPTQEWDGE